MKKTLTTYIHECLEENRKEQLFVELHRRSYLLRKLTEATARIVNLDNSDILRMLDDILSGQPVLNYTEKLAGTFFEVQITQGNPKGRYKDTKIAGFGFGNRDVSGILSTLRDSGVFAKRNALLQFEILDPERLSDYIDYALGGKTLAVEVTGKLSSQDAKALNNAQNRIRFMSQTDIIKRPKPLSPELTSKLQAMRDKVKNSPRVTAEDKKEIESLVSSSLVEIFGDSILGGRMEGLFVTGAGKPFKVPETQFANIQKLQAPIYAIFSGRGSISRQEIFNRLERAVANPSIAATDKIIQDIKNYLQIASKGIGTPGFRTFFSPNEASALLKQFNKILSGKGKAYDIENFITMMEIRIVSKRSWVKV